MAKILKGTICVTTCCNRRYPANFDFTPTVAPLVIIGGATYLRGDRCFACLFREEMVPKLKKHGISVHTS